MAVYREVWTGEVEKGFNEALKDTFLDGVKDMSRYVTGDDEAQVIHSTFFGVRPDVLINNTTYPIDIQELNGEDRVISLDKYQTKVTPIADDELNALAYDKIKEVKDAHVEALATNRLMKAIHAFAPNTDGLKTPVLVTTGANTEDGYRRRLRWADIINFRERLAKAKLPVAGMRLVLCADHVNDLLLEDQDFTKIYANRTSGIITSQLGLEIREYSDNPYFNAETKIKLSFGAVPADATDRCASVLFHVSKTRKAQGLTKMYYSEAKTDPQNQRNLINFRNYWIALPTANEAIGAIVSGLPKP